MIMKSLEQYVDHPEYGSLWRQLDFDVFNSDEFKKVLKDNDIKLVTWREIKKLYIIEIQYFDLFLFKFIYILSKFRYEDFKTILSLLVILLLFNRSKLILSLFSVDIKYTMLLADTFGAEVSNDGVLMFETFSFVLSSVIIGIICLILGSLSIRNLSALDRLSFLLFVVMGLSTMYQKDLIFGIS